ncbi:MAG: thiamine-phosphate kinase [Planctomycetota bacterium]
MIPGWSEDALHRWLQKRPRPAALVGSAGHDAAVLRERSGRAVVCVDACVEGVHFLAGAKPAQVAHKAVARALSDLAATAAVPEAITLALRAPKEADERYLRALLAGVAKAGARFGAELVGGDLTAAPGPLSLTVTALGRLPGRRRAPGRDRARAGQVLLLTGPVGGSILGRHLRFEPRLAEGRALFECGATALMDVSDGLCIDLRRIARASQVCLHIDQVPLHADARRRARQTGRTALEHGLLDGEDHELLATLPAQAWRNHGPDLQRRFPKLVAIGRVERGHGLEWLLPEPLPAALMQGAGGWLHGNEDFDAVR